ncbi:MAG: cysteine desulfurase [Alphaproteobacteria bacterium]|nr:cysteine desulfurase [Alphaproteobacteria bacterium]
MTKPATLDPRPHGFDAWRAREDFPILKTEAHGKPLVYLDSAASAQKPRAVIEAVRHVYEAEYANIHRGVYELSEKTTAAFEGAREKVRAFLNAPEAREILFVRGATEGINLVAQSFGRAFLKEGDEIILSALEHHSNIVPWQLLRDITGIVLRVVPVNNAGELEIDAYAELLNTRTRLVAMTHVSNAIGTVTPIHDIVRLAHERGVPVLVDGCQAVPHQKVDVQDFDCDFYVFSGHKLYGPSGIGVLYGKAKHLEAMPPYQGGGDMIRSVTFEKTDYNVIPHKFEAGTPHIAGAIGLGAAIDYLEGLGIPEIMAHEQAVLHYATERLSRIRGLRPIGTAREKASILSFVLDRAHPHDVGTVLDGEGVAIRTGHHCAQPLMERFGIPATARASFGLYNTPEDVDALAAGLEKVLEIFG